MVVATMASCTLVDSGEVGIRFQKFSLTDQGTLSAEPVSGFVTYNPFSESVYTYPIFIQRVDYTSFTVTTKDAAVFTMDPQIAYQLNRDKAKDVFAKMLETSKYPEEIIAELGLTQVTDNDAILNFVKEVVQENPKAVEDFKNGKTNVVGWLMGQVMKKSGGKANPKTATELLKQILSEV